MNLRYTLLLAAAGLSFACFGKDDAPTLKTTVFDCEAWELGAPPKDVFVVEGKISVVSSDGGKALAIDPAEIVDATAQVGDSAAGASIIEARMFASRRGRSVPRFGVSVHGMSGHRLLVNCAKKQLDLVKADEVVASAPFVWAAETWTRVKLSVTKAADGSWVIEGKAWADGSEEPKEAAIRHLEPAEKIRGNGKAAFWGTPFSGTPILIDDVKVQMEVKAD